MSGDTDATPLTDAERHTVEEHLPLVSVHLRERVQGRRDPTRDREWEDLFQEGCRGLMQAVRTYSPDSGIPFSAYALPRIHTAVSRAVRGGFATVKQPLYRRRGGDDGDAGARVVSIDFDPEDRRARPRHDPGNAPSGETIGDRVRDRYVRTVRRMAQRIIQTRPGRPDRDDLVRRIVEQRLLVPETEHRAPLRAIARDTKSSYARVAQCDKRLTQMVQSELADDAETRHLRETARHSEDGMITPLDTSLRRELEQVSTERYLANLAATPRERRAAVLLDLIERSGESAESVVRRLLAAMPDADRAAALDHAEGLC